jgi:ubiquinone/menaquinone biosynthesis C-methylase UbiE
MSSFKEFELQGWEIPTVVDNYHQHISTVTTQCAEALLDAAHVRSGCHLIDVATGAGYVAAAAHQRGAQAIGIDFSSAQISLAQRSYPALNFQQADAETLPVADETFDAYVCAFGLCHFPNPDQALREAYRVLKHNGRIAFSVWDQPERTVGFGALFTAIQKYGTKPLDIPAGPEFFQFSDPARCISALQEAGFTSPAVRQVSQVWRLSEADNLYYAVKEGSVRAAAAINSQTAEVREKIRNSLRETVEAHRVADHFEVPMPAIVATASKI